MAQNFLSEEDTCPHFILLFFLLSSFLCSQLCATTLTSQKPTRLIRLTKTRAMDLFTALKVAFPALADGKNAHVCRRKRKITDLTDLTDPRAAVDGMMLRS